MKIIFLIPLCNYCGMAIENIIAKFQPKILRNVGGVAFLVVCKSKNARNEIWPFLLIFGGFLAIKSAFQDILA